MCILTQRMLHQIQYMKEANCPDPVEKILDQLYLRRSRIKQSHTTRGHFLVHRLLFVGDLLYVLLSSLSLFLLYIRLYELISGVGGSSKIEVSCFSSQDTKDFIWPVVRDCLVLDGINTKKCAVEVSDQRPQA